jgi:hypothetical protein
VIVHYGQGASEADTLVQEIQATGGKAVAVLADLSLPSGVAELASQVRNFVREKLDVLGEAHQKKQGVDNASSRYQRGRCQW